MVVPLGMALGVCRFQFDSNRQILVLHYKPNCDRCHGEIKWDFAILIPVVLVYTGVVSAVDAVVVRFMLDWKWCVASRHQILRLIVRLVLTSTAALILMRILYEVADASRMR